MIEVVRGGSSDGEKEAGTRIFGDAARLTDMMVHSRGRVIVLMHVAQAQREQSDVFEKISRALETQQKNPVNMPVVIFEEEGQVAKMREWCKSEFGDTFLKRIFFVPTAAGDPLPNIVEDWNDIRAAFKAVSTKTLYIGGILMNYPQPLGTHPHNQMGCVNTLWRELSQMEGVTVIPALAGPMGRRDAEHYRSAAEDSA